MRRGEAQRWTYGTASSTSDAQARVVHAAAALRQRPVAGRADKLPIPKRLGDAHADGGHAATI
jgi:hypothetical protein